MLRKFKIRPMGHQDIPTLLRIEQEVYPFPWHYRNFVDGLKQGKGWVCMKRHKLLGYIIVNMTSEECDIHNICVSPEAQGKGIGSRLLEFLLDYCQRLGLKEIFLEVRASNIVAHKLYEKHGFYQYGVRKRYYRTEHGCEHALLYKREFKVESLPQKSEKKFFNRKKVKAIQSA